MATIVCPAIGAKHWWKEDARRQGDGPRTLEDYEALRRNLPSYRAQPSQADYEAYRRNLPAYHPQPSQTSYEAYRRNLPAYKPVSAWKKAGDWIANRLDDAAESVQSGWDAFRVRHLKFTKLEDGHISVRAETPPGTRMDYRRTVAEVMNSDADEFFGGTYYTPKTIAARTSGGLLRSAVSKGSLALAGVTSLASNLWTFGTNPAEGETFWDRTVRNREFWVSTAVDFAVSVAVGVAAAAVVAGVITLFAASFPVLDLPAVAIGLTAGVAGGLSYGLEYFQIPKQAKDAVNRWLSKE